MPGETPANKKETETMKVKDSKYSWHKWNQEDFEPEKGFKLCLECKNFDCIGYNSLKPEFCYNKELTVDDLEDSLDLLAMGNGMKKILRSIGLSSFVIYKNKLKKAGYDIEEIFIKTDRKGQKIRKEWMEKRLKEIQNGI